MSCYVVAQKILDQRMGGMKKIAWGSNADAGRGVHSAPPHFISCQPRDASSDATSQTISTTIPSHFISTFGSPFPSRQCDRMHQLVGPSRGLTQLRRCPDTMIQRGSRIIAFAISSSGHDALKRGSNMVKAERTWVRLCNTFPRFGGIQELQ